MAILALIVGFAVAVVLPNEIGTHELPATGGKHIVAKARAKTSRPEKGGPAVSLVLLQLGGLARCSGCISEARLELVPPAVSQLSPRLLI